MSTAPRTPLAALLSAAFFGAAVTVLFSWRSPELLAREKIDESLISELKVFTDVLALVQESYVKEIGGKDLAAGAIKGMMSALDPHSAYLDPSYFDDLQSQTKGEFGGLGIEIAMKDGMLVVVAPMEGTPADRAGIQPGDIIVKVDGEYLRDVSLVDIVKRLRGPRGSTVRISVMRKLNKIKLKEYSIVRDKIHIKSIKSRALGDGYGYVRISQFMETTGADLKRALSEIEKETGPIKGLILDLRNNPGGLLTQAIEVSDLFLKEGVVVYTKGRVASQEQKFYAHAAGTQPDYPVVVIINGGSASASEIVSGALKDHGRALIVGRQSFGKGSVQTINPLDNGGAVQLTTALYYTSSGRSIQALGVVPDVEFAPEEEESLAEQGKVDTGKDEEIEMGSVRESDLPGAFSNPSQGKQKGKIKEKESAVKLSDLMLPEQLDNQTWLKRDTYARRAFELLKTFNVLGKSK
jgi:carboxyl-terminal processing protease